MMRYRPALRAPLLIGVGAAFDMLAGAKSQAPAIEMPDETGQVAGDHVRQVVDPEVESGHPDQDDQRHQARYPGQPAPVAQQSPAEVGQEQVEGGGHHGVTRWEQELLGRDEAADGRRSRAMVEGLEDVVETLGAGGSHQDARRGAPAPLPDEHDQQHDEQPQDDLGAEGRHQLHDAGERGRT